MSYLEKVTDIYNLLGEGKAMDAFEKYYAENVNMILEDGKVVEGKIINEKKILINY